MCLYRMWIIKTEDGNIFFALFWLSIFLRAAWDFNIKLYIKIIVELDKLFTSN